MATPLSPSAGRIHCQIGLATASQRQDIYRMRHAIYATELRQHPENGAGALRDGLDDDNIYIAATVGDRVVGFISITPPGRTLSIDKYFSRESLPFACHRGLYELRLLSVSAERRGQGLAALLMYSGFRWVEAHGGSHIVALGRHEVLDLYLRVGLRATGEVVRSGAVSYHLLHESIGAIGASIARRSALLRRLERHTRWNLGVPFVAPSRCYHGGAFFESVGEEFDRLGRSAEVINADVLDAWFPPSPSVLEVLRDHLPWLARTSPPSDCGGLVRTIARVRDLEPAQVLPGGGSSDLIFRALPRWLSSGSRVLTLDPMYGEYGHILENVIRCGVDRWRLSPDDDYRLDPDAFVDRLRSGRYDLAVIVNPNSPTGQHVPREALEAALARVPSATRVWVDETYIDYAGDQSLERFAAQSENVIVCKSMSKVYALSGMRAGYLCGSPAVLADLRAYTPPWVVGLPAQVAAVKALGDLPYYRARWQETHSLREALADSLRQRVGLEVLPGVANFLLCRLPAGGPSAATVVSRAREHGLFLRDGGAMGTRLGSHALRIAVKDAQTNQRVLQILSGVV